MIEVIAPINIALIKYWGKSDELNIQPVTDSVSLTLNCEHLHSRTAIYLVDDDSHTFRLNGKIHPLTIRMKDVIINSQLRAMQRGTFDSSKRLCIESSNNFPTAAGLASSASGFASMAFALSNLYQLDGDTASLARRGSGSACRSMFGGVVHWKVPTSESKLNSPCVKQLFPHDHWPDLRILICVTSSQQKPVSSSTAMRRTTATSPLFQEVRAKVVKERVPQFIHAFQCRDFELLAELTMRESNELLAVCLDSWPPVVYLNATSFAIMEFVHTLNSNAGRNMAAYTFDAGPNAFILTTANDAAVVLTLLSECFGNSSHCLEDANELKVKRQRMEMPESRHFEVRGISYSEKVNLMNYKDLLEKLPKQPGAIKYVISTEVRGIITDI
nr:diphosphomevalonate decarboxylase [Hymenolepis microstoma]